jgi:hypothetical protein
MINLREYVQVSPVSLILSVISTHAVASMFLISLATNYKLKDSPISIASSIVLYVDSTNLSVGFSEGAFSKPDMTN